MPKPHPLLGKLVGCQVLIDKALEWIARVEEESNTPAEAAAMVAVAYAVLAETVAVRELAAALKTGGNP